MGQYRPLKNTAQERVLYCQFNENANTTRDMRQMMQHNGIPANEQVVPNSEAILQCTANMNCLHCDI